jgi:hypothetical protein
VEGSAATVPVLHDSAAVVIARVARIVRSIRNRCSDVLIVISASQQSVC